MSARARACLLLAFATVGCNGGTSTPADCDRSVSPSGGDDTAAATAMFVAAQDGETLCFSPGTYHMNATIEIRDRTGVTIRGTGASPADVVLDFSAQAAGAKGISATAMTDVTIENMTVLDASSDDVYVTGSDGVVLRNIIAGWMVRTGDARGAYAIYPVSSSNVLVEGCEAFGSPDAGIYVGQVTNCIVRDNEAHDNVAGAEIENSTNCEVMNNDFHDNTGGLLVFELATLAERGMTTNVHDNMIHHNNLANFCHPGTTVCGVPQGTGIMLMAANNVEVHGNDLEGNGGTAMLIISYLTAVAVADFPAPTDPTYDPAVDDICVHGNTYTMNGSDPMGPLQLVWSAAGHASGEPLEDIVWDGMDPDAELVIEAADPGTFVDIDAMNDFASPSFDKTVHAGTCTPIPAVVFP